MLKNNLRKKLKGQVTVEFSFTMVIAFLMVYGLIKIFDWSARDLIDRQRMHEEVLFTTQAPGTTTEYTGNGKNSAQLAQISPYFFGARDMNAIYGEK